MSSGRPELHHAGVRIFTEIDSQQDVEYLPGNDFAKFWRRETRRYDIPLDFRDYYRAFLLVIVETA